MQNTQTTHKHNDFNAISVSVASPEQILSWSHGEVKNPETINYRTQKPERDGLFCERIFGPTKNYECYCGKYKRIRYKGVICEKCGVEVTKSTVRRVRMGHITLAVPIVHLWYLRSTPSRIGLLLDLPVKTIEQVVYFAAYIITTVDEEAKNEAINNLEKEFDEHKSSLKKEYREKAKAAGEKEADEIESDGAKKLDELTEQYNIAKNQLSTMNTTQVLSELEYRNLSMKFGHAFTAGTGAEAIRDIIKNINIEDKINVLTEELATSNGQKQKKLIKRIRLLGSLQKAEINPEWTILTVLPVIPPEIRPMVQLDGGRFAASDLNDLYRRVINRNNRLKRLMSIGAPEVICRNEKRMLQEAVDALINNSARQSRSGFNAGDKRKLRSLSDMLKGKQGRFRQNLLGKRVDYSGRSVIVVGPDLKLHQCGLPKKIALELFKPFVIGKLIKNGYAYNIKNAEKIISSSKREVWDILEEITSENYVLLNRAPTLHRLGIQAFQPKLIEGKAIQIHPLVCAAFNADFDGDQMAVHLPLSEHAQREAKELICSANNLLKPSAGEPIITPSQDMVLGMYYLTQLRNDVKGVGMAFGSKNEALTAYAMKHCHLQASVKVRLDGEIIETTIGRVIFNDILPKPLQFFNQSLTSKGISKLIKLAYEVVGKKETAIMADKMKDVGFKYATLSGISIAMDDTIIPGEKTKLIEEATTIVRDINKLYDKGYVTDHERYQNIIKTWAKVKKDITSIIVDSFNKDSDIYYMVDSGARGKWGQVIQLCGMKGLVANPAGKTIELPVKSSLKEGFTILEYFIASHAGRKGKSDTALKTAEAGYLTRRLVDAVQDIIVKEDDCGSTTFNTINIKEDGEYSEDQTNRLIGRTIGHDLSNPKTGEIVASYNDEITDDLMSHLIENKIEEVPYRSILGCRTANGICKKCYGKDLGTNKEVEIGAAVGIIAAQSIGEPGTQLTMRTFHMGGIADGEDITQGLTRVEELFEARNPKHPAVLSDIPGKVKVKAKAKKIEVTIVSEAPINQEYVVDTTQKIEVKEGQKVKANELIAKGKTLKSSIICDSNCKVISIEENVITVQTDSIVEKVYTIPHGKILRVKNGQIIEKGMPITAGHINLKELIEFTSFDKTQQYIVEEIQRIYSSQGQNINDKHMETIIRQMCSKVRVGEVGDSPFLPGEVSDYIRFNEVNESLRAEGKKAANGERLLLGLTRISLQTNSWLSAASFQETIKVLVEASTTRRIDMLNGLKENVIIGKLIPAGEIYKKHHMKKKELESKNSKAE